MSLPAVDGANYPAPSEVLGILLRAITFAFARRGLVADVSIGSDHYIRAKAYADQVSIAIANNKIALADANPLTATGQALITLAGIFGVKPRPASFATGPVKITCLGTVTIPKGFTCTSGTNQQYKAIADGTYSTGDPVNVIAVVAGSGGNLPANAKITWDSAAIGNLQQVAVVGAGGIVDGVDQDNDDRLRARLLRRLANPAVGGNWAYVVEQAENASAAVFAAYAFPAVQGPASYDVALVGADGDRTLNATTVNNVSAAVDAVMPGQQKRNFTTITPQFVDVVLKATLPLPQEGGGAGGGWRDVIPWPAEDTKVTVGASTAVITVNSTASPLVGNHIGLWDTVTDPKNPRMREYIVDTVSGGAGAWVITVQGGFGFLVPVGAYVSAGAVNLTGYSAAVLASLRTLGPGEKTTSPEILPLGRRRPGADIQDPTDLTYPLLSVVTSAYPELLDLIYTQRLETGTLITRTSPSTPLTTADPPNLLVLKHLALHA